MFKVKGWKRLECNKMLQFHGITENIFQSIVRRFGVMVVKCRLMDKDWLEKKLPDHEKYGIFVREPDLQTWVESGPGRAAGLLLQLDFEKRCGGESGCRKITRSYTQLGGDHGVTRQVMREACGLKPDVGNATGDSVLHNLLKDFAGDAHNVGVVYHDRMEMPEEMVALQQYYVKSMISKKLDHLTPGYVSKIPAPLFVDCAKGEICAKLSQMKDAWTSAKAAAMARTTGGRPANVDMFLIPIVRSKNPIQALYDPPAACWPPKDLKESHSRRKFKELVANVPHRQLNMQIFSEWIAAKVQPSRGASKRVRGEKASLKVLGDSWREIARKEAMLSDTFDNAPPSRRLRRKKDCAGPADAPPAAVEQVSVCYEQNEWRSRSYLCSGVGVQPLPQYLQMSLLEHAVTLMW